MALQSSVLSAASALITDLIESGSFSSAQVSACDYGVLDNSGTCAIVVQPQTSTMSGLAFGTWQSTWGLLLQCFTRDTGDPVMDLRRIYDLHDALAQSITAGSHLNVGDRYVQSISFSRSPDVFVRFGDLDFLPTDVVVTIFEEG